MVGRSSWPGGALGDGATFGADTTTFAGTLVGRSEGDATEAIRARGLIMRIVGRDGESFAVTMDYSEQRINLVIDDGLVVEATVG